MRFILFIAGITPERIAVMHNVTCWSDPALYSGPWCSCQNPDARHPLGHEAFCSRPITAPAVLFAHFRQRFAMLGRVGCTDRVRRLYPAQVERGNPAE